MKLDIDKLCEVQRFIKEQYYKHDGLCGVDADKVHITSYAFEQLCEENNLDFEINDIGDGYEQFSTLYNSTTFIALFR